MHVIHGRPTDLFFTLACKVCLRPSAYEVKPSKLRCFQGSSYSMSRDFHLQCYMLCRCCNSFDFAKNSVSETCFCDRIFSVTTFDLNTEL